MGSRISLPFAYKSLRDLLRGGVLLTLMEMGRWQNKKQYPTWPKNQCPTPSQGHKGSIAINRGASGAQIIGAPMGPKWAQSELKDPLFEYPPPWEVQTVAVQAILAEPLDRREGVKYDGSESQPIDPVGSRRGDATSVESSKVS